MSITSVPQYTLCANHCGIVNDFALILQSGEALSFMSHGTQRVIDLICLINIASDEITQINKRPRTHVRYVLDTEMLNIGTHVYHVWHDREEIINIAMEMAAFCPGKRFSVLKRQTINDPWKEIFACSFPV